MTTAIAVTDEMAEAAARVLNKRLAEGNGLHGVSRDMLEAALAALTPHGEEAAAPAPEPQPIGFMDVEGIRTLVGDVRVRPAASPSPQYHLVGEPTGYLVKRYSNDGVLLDTELSFTKPVIRSTAKTEFEPLYRQPAPLPHVLGRPDGHCGDDAAWEQFSKDYGERTRADLCKGDLTDFALANAQFMCDRDSLDLIVYQTAAKERIRWLSIQLARALASEGQAE